MDMVVILSTLGAFTGGSNIGAGTGDYDYNVYSILSIDGISD